MPPMATEQQKAQIYAAMTEEQRTCYDDLPAVLQASRMKCLTQHHGEGCTCGCQSPMPPKNDKTSSEKVMMHVMAVGTKEMLTRPCVDCGQITGSFCDYCLAKDRVEDEEWADGQATPLCMSCDRIFDMCHFCRREHWVRPPSWQRGGFVP